MNAANEPFLVPTLEQTTHMLALWLEQTFRDERLTQAEAHILAYLSRHAPCTINDVHHSFGHKRSTLTSLLDRLEGKGWVIRRPHRTSRRLVEVDLTESGRQIGERVSDTLQDLEQRVMAHFSTEDAATFLRVIHALQEEITHEQQL